MSLENWCYLWEEKVIGHLKTTNGWSLQNIESICIFYKATNIDHMDRTVLAHVWSNFEYYLQCKSDCIWSGLLEDETEIITVKVFLHI